MKKISVSLIALVVLISCSPDDKVEVVDPFEEQAKLLEGTWSARLDSFGSPAVYWDYGGIPDNDWSNFKLVVSDTDSNGGIYSTRGVPDADSAVWAADGMWEFDSNENFIIRTPDTVKVWITNISRTTLILRFDQPTQVEDHADSAICICGGDWRFELVK